MCSYYIRVLKLLMFSLDSQKKKKLEVANNVPIEVRDEEGHR